MDDLEGLDLTVDLRGLVGVIDSKEILTDTVLAMELFVEKPGFCIRRYHLLNVRPAPAI